MSGILKEFKPLLKNNVHDQYKDFWKFVVTIESNGATIEGEAMAKNQSGSKSWVIGSMHDFTKKENQYAQGGLSIQGLKVQENAPTQSTSSSSGGYYTMEKESYTISRYSHSLALDYVNSLPEKEAEKMRADFGSDLISKFAESIAKSVDKVAKMIQAANATGNS